MWENWYLLILHQINVALAVFLFIRHYFKVAVKLLTFHLVHVPIPNDKEERPFKPNFWVTVVISAALLSSSLFIILNREFPEAEKRWAFGTMGSLVGYWFKK